MLSLEYFDFLKNQRSRNTKRSHELMLYTRALRSNLVFTQNVILSVAYTLSWFNVSSNFHFSYSESLSLSKPRDLDTDGSVALSCSSGYSHSFTRSIFIPTGNETVNNASQTLLIKCFWFGLRKFPVYVLTIKSSWIKISQPNVKLIFWTRSMLITFSNCFDSPLI